MGLSRSSPAPVAPVYWDPLSHELNREPYAIYGRLRDEAPVYYNDRYGFYVLSRFQDVYRARLDPATFSSSHSVHFERLLNPSMPLNFMSDMDPPVHTAVRKVVSRAFTPSQISKLEDRIRAQCVTLLDRLADETEFDYVEQFAKPFPFLVICELLGVDPEDQEQIAIWWDEREALITAERDVPDLGASTAMEAKIRDFLRSLAFQRVSAPRDDMMTFLVDVEVTDPDGTVRRLTEEEVGEYCRAFFIAGSATTTQMLAWMVLLLGRYPDCRRLLVEDPGRIPNAIEESLRYEPPSPSGGRWLLEDVELHGTTIPRDSVVMLLTGAASRDEREYERADAFDVTRKIPQQLAFGSGVHLCLGAALARLEGRIAFEETLARFPDWDIDEERAAMRISSGMRGWNTLPLTPGRTRHAVGA
jgi:cytochrome P450